MKNNQKLALAYNLSYLRNLAMKRFWSGFSAKFGYIPSFKEIGENRSDFDVKQYYVISGPEIRASV